MKRFPIRRRAKAQVEILAHVEHIAESDLDAALRFVDAAEGALDHLSAHPEMGSPYQTENARLGSIRKWVLPRFPNYVLFYHFNGDAVHLLHLFHGAQDYDPDT